MPRHAPIPVDLDQAALGDIVTLPDGRELTVRSSVRLPEPVCHLTGFVLVGELELLIAQPADRAHPLAVYAPVPYTPPPDRQYLVQAEGVANYFAPHLPAQQNAMGELLFRVLQERGALDPLLLIFRDDEMIVFIKVAQETPGKVKVLHLPGKRAHTAPVARHAALPVGQPLPVAGTPGRRRGWRALLTRKADRSS